MLQKGEAIRQKAYKKKEWQQQNKSGEVKKDKWATSSLTVTLSIYL